MNRFNVPLDTLQVILQIGDNLPSQSLDWWQTRAFSTNHL